MSKAIDLLDDIMTTLRESKRYRCASIIMRARCVLPFCRAHKTRFVFRLNKFCSLTLHISLITKDCQGSSGIPMSSASCATSLPRVLPVRYGVWMRGSVAPISAGLVKVIYRLNPGGFGPHKGHCGPC